MVDRLNGCMRGARRVTLDERTRDRRFFFRRFGKAGNADRIAKAIFQQCAIPTADLIRPSSALPASVTPKCKDKALTLPHPVAVRAGGKLPPSPACYWISSTMRCYNS